MREILFLYILHSLFKNLIAPICIFDKFLESVVLKVLATSYTVWPYKEFFFTAVNHAAEASIRY